MSTTAKSFYAARGDNSLRSMNAELSRLALTKEDFADLQASRQNDGVWLSLIYRDLKQLRLESSSIQHGSWFHKNTTPATIELIFNVPIDASSIVANAFKWITSSTAVGVSPTAVSVLEGGVKLELALPTLTNYTGPVTLTIDKITSARGQKLAAPLSINFQITESNVPKAQSGTPVPYTASLTRGLMTIGRVVAAFGMSADAMLRSYIKAKGLENSDILKVVQVAGPERSVELFVLAWQSRSPSVKSTSPLPSSTISQESAPNQILVEFDEEVSSYHLTGQDGINRVFYNGTPLQSVSGITVTKLDDRGMQWLFRSASLFTSAGNHVLTVRNVPNKLGLRPGGIYHIPWQVLPLQRPSDYCQDFVADGVSSNFALTAAPIACTLQVFMNGVFQHPDCYSVTGTTLTMVATPFTGAQLRIMYRS